MPPTEPSLRVLVRHSAAEKDVALAGELLQHLDPLKRFAGVEVWSEARIRPGDNWRDEIRRAIDQANVALVLLSSDFLATDGLIDVEVPRLLERHRAGALRVIPILLRSCLWEVHPWLRELNPLPKGGKAIGSFSADAQDEVLTELAKAIVSLASTLGDEAEPTRSAGGTAPPKISGGPGGAAKPDVEVSVARLATLGSGSGLFGRQPDIAWMNACWADGVHMASVIAFGGMGKSALVWHWLSAMRDEGWRCAERAAERVYGWSFYSQGTKDQMTSADAFIAAALAWFGDPRPDEGSPWDRGERLARLVKEKPALLVLDGVEPLQVGSSRVDLQACKLEYSIVSPK